MDGRRGADDPERVTTVVARGDRRVRTPADRRANGGSAPELTDLQRRLRAAELRYRTLAEQIPAVTFLAVLGEQEGEQPEIYVSPYIETLLGFTQTEWLENPSLWFSQLHPDDRELWRDQFVRALRTGDRFTAECRYMARDGRTVWVRGEARLVKDEQNRPLFLQGVAFDITESRWMHSRELEEAVHRTEQRYRDLVEHLDAIFLKARSDTGQLTFVSGGAEALLGFPRERWIADREFWLGLVHPDDRESVSRLWAHALATSGEHEFEFRAIAADERELWLHARVQAPQRGISERSVFGVMLDVTARKRGEEERARLLVATDEARQAAEAASRAKDEFLATMSHELKTPLNALLGYAQLLRRKQMPAELTEVALESIERNAKAQAKLVNDLLDVSLMISGKLHLEVRAVDLAETIEAALETMRLAADAKRLTMESNLDRSGLRVSGDPSRLQQVVWNIVSNAVRFTPEDGRVEVRLDRVGDHARIQVIDSGQGISQDFVPHVFERFRQADGSVRRTHGGLGLGLALTRHIIEMHGGTISVYSAGLGKGTTFTVLLPLSVSASGGHSG